jgi:hypothetical protein
LAKCVAEVAESPAMAEGLSATGQVRSRDFSWKIHVDELLDLARSLVALHTPSL